MTYAARETSVNSGQPVECYFFTQGTNSFKYTSADEPILLPSGTYDPEVISHSEISQSQELDAGSTDVLVPIDNPVAKLFIAYLPVTPVHLTIFRKHVGDTEFVVTFIGEIVSFKNDGPQTTLTAASLQSMYKKKVPSAVFQTQCNLVLYSPQCGADKNLFKAAGTTTSVAGVIIRVAEYASKPDGYFDTGWAERDNGDVRFILEHVGDTITLQTPFPDLAAGEILTAFAGCQRTEQVCNNKFNRLVSHIGFARIPSKNPYDGSIT